MAPLLPPTEVPKEFPHTFIYYAGELEIVNQEGLTKYLAQHDLKVEKSGVPQGTPFYKHKIEMTLMTKKSALLASELSLFFYLAERAALSNPREDVRKKFTIVLRDEKMATIDTMQSDGISLQISTNLIRDTRWFFSLTSFAKRTTLNTLGDNQSALIQCAKMMAENRSLDSVKLVEKLDVVPGIYI